MRWIVIARDLRNLDGWVRRRLRSLAWTQWRTGRRRYRALRHHGISARLAATTAASARAHGPWRLSRHPVLQAALSVRFFAVHGLPALAPGCRMMPPPNAVYGPVRTVVWEGRS